MNDTLETRVPLFSLDRRKSTILRGIAILYVILGHAGYLAWGGAGGVALFLLLSGYGLDRSCQAKGLEDFWKKRALRVWLPYLPVGLFNVLVLRVTWLPQTACTLLGLDLCRNVDKSMWYISFILFWYLVFYAAVLLTRRIENVRLRESAKLALLLLGAGAAFVMSRFLIWSGSSGARNYVLLFPLGVALSVFGRIEVKEKLRRLLWAGVFFLASAYMVISYGMTPWTWKYALFMALQILAPSQLLQLGGGAERLLRWCGEYSYPMYLIEMTMLDNRAKWLGMLELQPLIDLACLLLTALFAFAYWQCWKQLEELLTARRGRTIHNTENTT